MRRVQDILAEMKPLMGSLDAEERKKLDALEEELKSLQMTAEDKSAAKEWYEEGLEEIKESIGHIEHELKIRDQLKEVADILPLSYIAKNYFGKSAAWLYQRINGNKVRGKVYTLNREEVATFNRALKEIGSKISSLSITC
ncbi:DUF5053 domain-containing protein [uncultured Bacteroides sp.]|uniref:DUF5053 domain-containing protein n=1 Tax=uncultured Bacteroides sp. TaxID=162156 RepID=UPI0025867B6A|nr:DUF5053 domain-containing protein [uncultured Bacteroides sp.]